MSQNRWSFSAIRFKKTRQVRSFVSKQRWNWRCIFRTRPEAARERRRFDARRLDRQSCRLAAAPDAQEQHSRLQRRQIGAERSPTRRRPSCAAARDAREPKSYSKYAAAVWRTVATIILARRRTRTRQKRFVFSRHRRVRSSAIYLRSRSRKICKRNATAAHGRNRFQSTDVQRKVMG